MQLTRLVPLLTLALCLLGTRSEDGAPPAEEGQVVSPLATVGLVLTKTDGSKSPQALTLRPGQSCLSAAYEFVKEHSVNTAELADLAGQLDAELQKQHPDRDHAALGVEVFPTYDDEQQHATKAKSLLHEGRFQEAAIHYALAAEHSKKAEAQTNTEGVESSGEDKQARIADYHDSVSSIVNVAKTTAGSDAAHVEGLIAEEQWLEVLKVVGEAKRAGGWYQ